MTDHSNAGKIEAALFSDVTAEDVFKDPKKFGLPTFEEWPKVREKWLKTLNGEFGLIDAAGANTKHVTKKINYQYGMYKTARLEEMENILNNEGLTIHDVEWKPEFVNELGQKADILVRFIKKEKPAIESNG